jgi:nitrate reductase gamma subunit
MDTLLFAVLPYVALSLLVLVPVVRGFVAPRERGTAPASAARGTSWAWRYGLGLLLAGHVGGFLVALDRLPGGVIGVEAAALGAGLLALAGLGAFVRNTFASFGAGVTVADSLADTLLWTFVAIAVASGLAMSLVYRWGSSWFTVTLAPYLRSLVQLRPEVALVAEMPPLVRLHALAGIAAVAVLPFTRWGASPARRLTRLWAHPRRAPRPLGPSTTVR